MSGRPKGLLNVTRGNSAGKIRVEKHLLPT